MADERVRLTLPKRFRPKLDRLAEPLGMGHTEFVSWLIDSYDARDLALLPLVTDGRQNQTSKAQAVAISAPPIAVIPAQTDETKDNDDMELDL